MHLLRHPPVLVAVGSAAGSEPRRHHLLSALLRFRLYLADVSNLWLVLYPVRSDPLRHVVGHVVLAETGLELLRNLNQLQSVQELQVPQELV